MLNVVVDVSHHQDRLAFSRARAAGICAVIHKATQGGSGIDPRYAERRIGAEAEGMLWGAYHFGTGMVDAVGQADHFLEHVGSHLEGVLLVLDLEPNPHGESMSLADASTFVSHIEKKAGRYPVLYSGHWLKEQQRAHRPYPVLLRCPLWLAQYGPTPVLPVGWERWTLWQYTDGMHGQHPHYVDGIGFCDRSRFNGHTLEELEAFWHGTPLPPAA